MAGQMPPLGEDRLHLTIGRFFEEVGEVLQPTTFERPLRHDLSSMMKNSGMSARSTEPIIQVVASQLRERRGLVER